MYNANVENFLNRLHRDPSFELRLKGAMMQALSTLDLADDERELIYAEGIGQLELNTIKRSAQNGQGDPLMPEEPLRAPPPKRKKPAKKPPSKPVKKPARPAKKAPKKKK